MKRRAILGIVLLAIAIVVQFPAATLAPAVSRATNERWRLADVRGTVWQGSAELYSFDRTTASWSAGRGVSWRVLWGRVLEGVLAVQLELDDGGTARLALGARGWTLSNVAASFPAAQLAVLLPSTIGDYGWGGIFVARAGSFRCTWGRPLCTGQAELGWDEASTSQIPGPPLGDYRVRVTGEGEALRFAVSTVNGRLKVNGAGEVSGNRLRFTAEAQAADEDVRLENLLRAIGRPAGAPGRYLIEYREAPAAR